MTEFIIENIEILVFWMVLIIAIGSFVGCIFFFRFASRVLIAVHEIEKLRMDVRVRKAPAKGTYEDRLKKEYEKRGIPWERYKCQ